MYIHVIGIFLGNLLKTTFSHSEIIQNITKHESFAFFIDKRASVVVVSLFAAELRPLQFSVIVGAVP